MTSKNVTPSLLIFISTKKAGMKIFKSASTGKNLLPTLTVGLLTSGESVSNTHTKNLFLLFLLKSFTAPCRKIAMGGEQGGKIC